MKTWRIPFSQIKNAGLRRVLMLAAYLPMLVCNWLLILWAGLGNVLVQLLLVLMHVVAAPVRLLKNFNEVWHGRTLVWRADEEKTHDAN